MKARIGIVGDFDGRPTHTATRAALDHAASAADAGTDVRWLATEDLARDAGVLSGLDALLIAPGSPYRSLEGALGAIRFARERDLPLLGTCGGFQHVVLEYARNALGLENVRHAEIDPAPAGRAVDALVTPLACSLAGERSTVQLEPGSRVHAICGAEEVLEEYRCNYGLNPAHRQELERGGLRFSGNDAEGAARVLELPGLRFFLATLYVPQLSSSAQRPHPLFRAFIAAAAQSRSR